MLTKTSRDTSLPNVDHWLIMVDGYMRIECDILQIHVPIDLNKIICVFYQKYAAANTVSCQFRGKRFKLRDYLIPTKMIDRSGSYAYVFEAEDTRSDGQRVIIIELEKLYLFKLIF